MKKIFLVSFLAMLRLTSIAQTIEEKSEKSAKSIVVPISVKNAFVKDFPTVEKSKWSKEDANYEVEFKSNGTELSATYTSSGQRLEVETEIETGILPAAVSTYIIKNYPDYKVTEASRIVDQRNTTTYEAEIKKGREKRDIIFSEKGQFIKNVKPD